MQTSAPLQKHRVTGIKSEGGFKILAIFRVTDYQTLRLKQVKNLLNIWKFSDLQTFKIIYFGSILSIEIVRIHKVLQVLNKNVLLKSHIFAMLKRVLEGSWVRIPNFPSQF